VAAASADRRFRPAVAFILVTALLDVMAMGLVIPVLPALIVKFAGSDAAAGVWNGILVAIWAVAQFACSPLIGSLSDRYGRRPVILVSTAGLAIDWVVIALAPNLWWLALRRVIGGITSASFTAVNAYMADITAPEDRARGYGLVGAAFGAGIVTGPALGGILGEWGPRVPFWTAAGLSGLAFVYGLFVLPESLPVERRMAFSWTRANPLGALRLLRSHRDLSQLATIGFLLYFAHHVFTAVYVLYAAHRYGLGSLEVGLLLAVAGVLDMVVQGLLVGPLVARFGDRRVMIFGLVCGSFGLVALGLAANAWLFAATLVPNALWGLAGPTIQSLMTRRVAENEQGQLQGANNSVGSVAGIVSPLFFGWVYSLSVATLPGLSFVISAAILLGAAVLALFLFRDAELAEG
jgi:DHA1 family tetracycline resistance protein-like MFS transporter